MYDALLRHPLMSAVGRSACRDVDLVAAMCDFEIALARAQVRQGRLDAQTAGTIARHLRPQAFDLAALAEATPDGANMAIPFVAQARALLPEPAAAAVHRGATSQDVVDTALMRLLKPRLARLLGLGGEIGTAGAALMRTHRTTPMIGRTLMQQALPITFGRKVADWIGQYLDAERRLAQVAAHGLFVQFGGPTGVHADAGDCELMDTLAAELDLNTPTLPWHTNRQPVIEIVDAVNALAIAAEKIALDVALMAQNEIGELSEPAEDGVGGSSSMAHKRNPVACARIRAAARQIRGAAGVIAEAGAQPFERGLGEWHAEWAPLVDAVLLLEGALESLAALLTGLEVHADAMARNLAASAPNIMTAPVRALLARHMDDDRAAALAHEAAETARNEARDYADVLGAHAGIPLDVDPAELRHAADPAHRIGSSQAQIDRVLATLTAR